jgi:hypothetical protein
VVVIDDRGDVTSPASQCVVIRSRLRTGQAMSGFKNHEGIVWALQHGLSFDRVFCLDDDTLLIGSGLDVWAERVMQTQHAGLVGVADRVDYSAQWYAFGSLFRQHLYQAATFRPERPTVFYPMVWLSKDFVTALHQHHLLVPDGYETWPTWPDVYISWAAQLLGFKTYTHGSMDQPEAPLYANHPHTMFAAPQPWILHPDFKAYHSIKAVPHFTESQVRQYYQQQRLRAMTAPCSDFRILHVES